MGSLQTLTLALNWLGSDREQRIEGSCRSCSALVNTSAMAASSSPSSACSSSTFASSNSPCAACKFLRRKCMPGCIFAPYFPPEEPHKFANVHKIFGASNVAKLLNELLPHQREDAVNSMAYEAEARVKDPVYGCVGAISVLQRQVQRLQKELDAANADLLRYACNEIIPTGLPIAPAQPTPAMAAQPVMGAYQTIGHASGRSPAAFYHLPGSRMASPASWAAAGSMAASGESSNTSGNSIMDQIRDGRERSSM